jgi:hypothetical protein
VDEAVRNLEVITNSPENDPRDDPRAARFRASAHDMLAPVREAQGDAAAAAREYAAARRLRAGS